MATKQFHVPASKHHLIIGKGGTTIKSLQEAFKVNITIPRVGPGNVVIIEGDPESIELCRQHLEGVLAFAVSEDPIFTMELDIPNHKYGAVIGPGGTTLKSLQEACRVAITVPNDGKSPVVLQGTKKGCHECREKVLEITGRADIVSEDNKPVPQVKLDQYDLDKPVTRALFFPSHPEPADKGMTTIQVFLKYLSSAKKTMDVCIFTSTNDDICDCILTAHRRGVQVRVICDDDQMKATGSDIAKFKMAGIRVKTDNSPFHMHHKYVILDNKVLMNGSFNWTVQAVSMNNENVMITSDRSFVTQFASNFDSMWKAYS